MEDLLCHAMENDSCGDGSEAPAAARAQLVCTTVKSSESTIFGPTLDETVIYFLGMVLPEWLRLKLGMIDCEKDAPATKTNDPCTPLDVEDWLRSEYLRLSREVARACMNTQEATRSPMLEARRYVLNRLAELMEKKQMVEDEYRSRCMKGRGDCK